MNFKKKSIVLLIGLIFVTSLPASSKDKIKSSDDSSGVGTVVVAGGIILGLFGFGRHLWESWKRHHNTQTAVKAVDKKVDAVDKKVDRVQGTCDNIAAKQQGLSTQLTQVDTKVDGVQKTADTIQQDQQKLSTKVDAVKVVVDDNNAKLVVVDTQLKTVDVRVAMLSEEEQKRHSEHTARFNQQDIQLKDISKKIVDKDKTEKFMNVTEAHLNSIHAMNSEHTDELKRQSELLAQQKEQLLIMGQDTKKIESKADRTKRRVKAIFKYVKNPNEPLQDVSDSDDENTTQQQSVKIRAQTLAPLALAKLAMATTTQHSATPVS